MGKYARFKQTGYKKGAECLEPRISEMKFLVNSLLVVFCFYVCDCHAFDCVLPNTQSVQADYYWRNYFGVIPDDAVKGGYDENGNVTYIGQFLVDIGATPGILPGTIYPGQKRAVAVESGAYAYDDQYVKILCAPRQDLMSWRQTNLEDMHLLTDFHLVIGGWDAGSLLYIGRANVDNQVMTSKVYPKESRFAGLTLNSKATMGLKLSSFELLVYQRI